MSCLNLKRLLPHRKLWKVLTNKLPLKLIGSKAHRKQKLKHRSYKTSKKLSLPSLSIQPNKFKKHTVIHHKNHHCYSQRRPPPIFIDHLFVQPLSLVEEHVVPPEPKLTSSTSQNPNRKTSDDNSGQPAESGSGEEVPIANADDAWESMLLNSPQMDGIDARADEFIARFRAEMRQQEIQAQHL